MILIPYFLSKEANWANFGLFLRDGGSSLWSVEAKTTLAGVKKLLKENGFPVLSVKKMGDVFYAEIRPTINLSEYYLWSDLPVGSDEDVWRTFKIPLALWSCLVFKEHFFKETKLPQMALAPLQTLQV